VLNNNSDSTSTGEQLSLNEIATIDKDPQYTTSGESDGITIPEGKVEVAYHVKKNDSLLGIADLFDIRVSDIRNWNNIPYTKSIIVGQSIKIYVSSEKKDFYAAIDNQTEIERTTTKSATVQSSNNWVYHKVRRGESLGYIASKYHVNINSLRDWNNIPGSKIYVGNKLKILMDGNTKYATINDVPPSKTNLYRYRVKKGDTISELSEEFGVPSIQIKKWNNLTSDRLIAGKTLKIYSHNTSSLGDNTEKTNANLNYYKIKGNDTIGEIAELYKVKIASIRKWNNLYSNKIIAGKTLKIYSDVDINDLPEKVTANNPESKTNPVSGKAHKVTNGESLYTIARQYNTTISRLKELNNLTGNKIIMGQELIVE